LKLTQPSTAPCAENTAPMECSPSRLTSGPSASTNHLNQTASREYQCDGDLNETASLPHDSTMGWMAINCEEVCSSSYGQPHNH
jgi:hypothetical protein